MGKLKTFDIVFGSPVGVFTAGTAIQGHILIDLDKPMKMNCIKLHLSGRAKVHWSKNRGQNNVTHYRAAEDYFQHTVTLYGSGDRSSMHPAGRLTYPFNFPLRDELPSSFEGQYGYVRYISKVTIVKQWKSNTTITKPFTVLSPLDLNSEPHLRNPVEDRRAIDVSWLCCVSGNVTCNIKIDRQGYAPGEAITINGEIHNGSSTTVSSSKALLIQNLTFFGKSDAIFSSSQLKPKCLSRTVGSYSRGHVMPGTAQFWENVQLQIPSLPPSRMNGCQIIDVSYTFQFKVDPGWTHESFTMNKEVVLGTVPFHASQTVQPSAPPAEYGAGESFFTYDDMPPSYEQSVFGQTQFTEDGDGGQTPCTLSYAPVYTFYNTLGRSNPGIVNNQI